MIKPTKEVNIEQYLILEVEKRKGRCLKLTIYKGIPDRLVLLPNGFIAFIETKTHNGRLSQMQKFWQRVLSGLGFRHLIINSKDQVDEFTKIYDLFPK